jgi:FAD/FMN-containing dehydrogenase
VREALEAIFGAVREDPEAFAGDMTENEPRRPSFVVEATRAEQVGELLRLANERGLPVTPRVTGQNVGGLTIPADGGIVLDLSRMTDVEIDPAHAVAWIEPGVGWDRLKEAAARHDLTVGFPLSPPESSVLACCLMDGLTTRSLVDGSCADWIHGCVAYLADGTRVVTGSAAVSGRPVSRGPLPDLTGLFVGWFGATGIVVRLGIVLSRKAVCRTRELIPCATVEDGISAMREGAATGLFDDLGGLGWPAGKWALGVDRLGPRDPDEPELYLVADVSAETPGELRAKRRRLAAIAPRAPVPVEDLLRLAPDLAPFADLPTRLGFLLDHEGGGLSWVGAYGPTDRMEEVARGGIDRMEREGFPPLVVLRPMKRGHFGIVRFIERFDRSDEEETGRVRAMNVTLARHLLDHGYVPYKCPEVLLDEVLGRLDPGFRDLMLRIKRAVDPNGILNPDRWRLRDAY